VEKREKKSIHPAANESAGGSVAQPELEREEILNEKKAGAGEGWEASGVSIAVKKKIQWKS